MLTIVAYHYVRDTRRTRYPRIAGLHPRAFEGQLDYIARHYTVCGMRDVIAAARGETTLPCNPCVLTFDDGLADHFHAVFPRLDERKMTGCFYPPARAVTGGVVLDVHKIHFILASADTPARVVRDVLDLVAPYRAQHVIPGDAELYARHSAGSRFDGADATFVKRSLQHGLPEEVRDAIVGELFARYVTGDEAAFAAELYMDAAQLRCMVRQGMEIGGHGDRHLRLETLSRDAQAREIHASLALLTELHGSPPADWVMCYPYGSYDATTIALLRGTWCGAALTTRGRLARDLCAPYELERLDTTDLPTVADALPCEWTRASRAGVAVAR